MSAPEAFAIETGIPLPESKYGAKSPGPVTASLRKLSQSAIGASVVIPGIAQNRLGPYLQSAAGMGWYATRKVDGGTRVWKVAEPKAKASSQ